MVGGQSPVAGGHDVQADGLGLVEAAQAAQRPDTGQPGLDGRRVVLAEPRRPYGGERVQLLEGIGVQTPVVAVGHRPERRLARRQDQSRVGLIEGEQRQQGEGSDTVGGENAPPGPVLGFIRSERVRGTVQQIDEEPQVCAGPGSEVVVGPVAGAYQRMHPDVPAQARIRILDVVILPAPIPVPVPVLVLVAPVVFAEVRVLDVHQPQTGEPSQGVLQPLGVRGFLEQSRTGQQADVQQPVRDRRGSEARQQTEQMAGVVVAALAAQQVERELPGRQDRPTRAFRRAERRVRVVRHVAEPVRERALVGGEGTGRSRDLPQPFLRPGQIRTGQVQGERQAAELLGEGAGRRRPPGARGQVEQDAGPVLLSEGFDGGVSDPGPPPLPARLSAGDENRSVAVARGAQPADAVGRGGLRREQGRRIVHVVQHEQPGLPEPVEMSPRDVGGVDAVELRGPGTDGEGDGEHGVRDLLAVPARHPPHVRHRAGDPVGGLQRDGGLAAPSEAGQDPHTGGVGVPAHASLDAVDQHGDEVLPAPEPVPRHTPLRKGQRHDRGGRRPGVGPARAVMCRRLRGSGGRLLRDQFLGDDDELLDVRGVRGESVDAQGGDRIPAGHGGGGRVGAPPGRGWPDQAGGRPGTVGFAGTVPKFCTFAACPPSFASMCTSPLTATPPAPAMAVPPESAGARWLLISSTSSRNCAASRSCSPGGASSRASENRDAQAEARSAAEAAVGSGSAAVRSSRSRVIRSAVSFPRPRSPATRVRNVSHNSVPAADTTAVPPAAASAARLSVNMQTTPPM
ncbi:hypothetical protein P376_3178 [Streptomyces sp. HCCB10043]|nr:hypothetical protein P376_3178 [Streptomyces sp. HCCB10043]